MCAWLRIYKHSQGAARCGCLLDDPTEFEGGSMAGIGNTGGAVNCVASIGTPPQQSLSVGKWHPPWVWWVMHCASTSSRSCLWPKSRGRCEWEWAKLTRATKRMLPSQLFLPCFVGLVVDLESLSGVGNLCREIIGVEVHSRVHHGEHIEGGSWESGWWSESKHKAHPSGVIALTTLSTAPSHAIRPSIWAAVCVSNGSDEDHDELWKVCGWTCWLCPWAGFDD